MKAKSIVFESGEECKVLNDGEPLGDGVNGSVYMIETKEGSKFALKFSETVDLSEESNMWNSVMHDLGKEYEHLSSSKVANGTISFEDGSSNKSGNRGMMIMPLIEGVTAEHYKKGLYELLSAEGLLKIPTKEEFEIPKLDFKGKTQEQIRRDLEQIRVRTALYNKALENLDQTLGELSVTIVVSKIREKMLKLGYEQGDLHLGNYMVSKDGLVVPIDMGDVHRIELQKNPGLNEEVKLNEQRDFKTALKEARDEHSNEEHEESAFTSKK
ncbi:hypothetical protein [Legionella lansingensis]|nr:hypothetical protein [Legionella lansingensis]